MAVAVLDHLGEVVTGIDVHYGERHLARPERLGRQVQHHDRVLAAREQDHRALELPGHLADDVDRLVLEVGQPRTIEIHIEVLANGAVLADRAGNGRGHSKSSLRSSAISSSTTSSTERPAVSMRSSGATGGFVLTVNAGEPGEIPIALLGVEALDVALCTHLDRGGNVDLEERHVLMRMARTPSRAAANGDTTEASTSTPLRASKLATQPMRATLASRSARE